MRSPTGLRWPRRNRPGVGALLVSAANASGVQVKPEQVRQALMSSARYITEGSRYLAYDQGAGLLDVNAAWDLLRTNLTPVTITGRVASGSPLADFLEEPGVGNGIYDREECHARRGVLADVHVHADGRPWRLEDVRRQLGRQ